MPCHDTVGIATLLLMLVFMTNLTACGDGGQNTADGPEDSGGHSDVWTANTADTTPDDAADTGSLAVCSTPEAPMLDGQALTVDGTRLRDSLGREVMLRGTNTGGRSKFPPYFPFPFAESGHPTQVDAPPFDTAMAIYLDRFVTWGHNVARVPFSWEAVEPEHGRYDAMFVARYRQFIEALALRGIRVIVDFHQDVFARPYCGDGFPLWAVPAPYPDPPPPEECSNWFLGYLNDARVHAAYDRFWTNDDGLQDDFIAMWRHMAQQLWGIDGLFAFEIINEPHFGTNSSDTWGEEVLAPFYTRVAAAIREEAPEALVVFDPTGLEAFGSSAEISRPEGDGLIFGPHYYDPEVFIFGPTATIEPDPFMDDFQERSIAWQVPLLVGEFGIKTGQEGGAAYMRANWDALDRYLFHGTVWEYATTVDDWNNEGFGLYRPDEGELPEVDEAIRAYPTAVSGTVVQFTFDRDARSGQLIFDAVPGITEIAAPERLYPEPPQVSIAGVDGCVAFDSLRGLLLIRTTQSGRATATFGP
ncbi:MAG: cellulase family glycosylhydrolase [Myxococcota bacterium]